MRKLFKEGNYMRKYGRLFCIASTRKYSFLNKRIVWRSISGFEQQSGASVAPKKYLTPTKDFWKKRNVMNLTESCIIGDL